MYEVIGAALEMYGGSAQCVELLQQVVQHVLADPRVTAFAALGAADQQPELAECCAKVQAGWAPWAGLGQGLGLGGYVVSRYGMEGAHALYCAAARVCRSKAWTGLWIALAARAVR